jgi:hypothetical protein
VLLIAVHLNGHEAGGLEALQLPLHRTASRLCQLHDLGNKKAAIGLSEEQTEDLLLCRREQGVGK